MRLLNTHTLKLEHYPDARSRPKYAILSHTWGKAEDEVLYAELNADLEKCRDKEGFQKIRYTCDEARESGIDHAWIDTCCKPSVQQSISSLY